MVYNSAVKFGYRDGIPYNSIRAEIEAACLSVKFSNELCASRDQISLNLIALFRVCARSRATRAFRWVNATAPARYSEIALFRPPAIFIRSRAWKFQFDLSRPSGKNRGAYECRCYPVHGMEDSGRNSVAGESIDHSRFSDGSCPI